MTNNTEEGIYLTTETSSKDFSTTPNIETYSKTAAVNGAVDNFVMPGWLLGALISILLISIVIFIYNRHLERERRKHI